jgi:hypothetical protein
MRQYRDIYIALFFTFYRESVDLCTSLPAERKQLRGRNNGKNLPACPISREL